MEKNRNLTQKSKSTVDYLINFLEKEGLKPVIARNYENYPDFDHDLDLFLTGNLKTATLIFIKVAEIQEWEILTLCSHYANFKNEEFNILTFNFYQLETMQTLKVDLFGGLNLWGQPLIDRHKICKNRILEPQGRFYTMKQDWENGYRIFQIANLNPKKNRAKIDRYTKRVLNFNMDNPGVLASWSKTCKLGNLNMAIKALENRNNKKLQIIITASKLKFIFFKALKNPSRIIKNILDRKKGLNMQFNTNPCGPLLFLSGDKKILSKQLDILVSNKILPGWSENEDRRERGWAFICFKKGRGKETDFEKLLSLVISRHKLIYSSFKNKL